MFNLDHYTAEEAARAAIANHALFKAAIRPIAAVAPSEAAARILIEAYRTKTAPPWLVACLLGYAGHPIGYPVAREILLSNPRQLAESYAGVAMARTGGDEAYAELKRIFVEAEQSKVRIGAGWGLTKYKNPELIGIFVDALRNRRVPRTQFDGAVARLRPGDAVLEELLTDSDDRVRRFGVHVINRMLFDKSSLRPSVRILQLAREVAAGRRLSISDELRKLLGTYDAPPEQSGDKSPHSKFS